MGVLVLFGCLLFGVGVGLFCVVWGLLLCCLFCFFLCARYYNVVWWFGCCLYVGWFCLVVLLWLVIWLVTLCVCVFEWWCVVLGWWVFFSGVLVLGVVLGVLELLICVGLCCLRLRLVVCLVFCLFGWVSLVGGFCVGWWAWYRIVGLDLGLLYLAVLCFRFGLFWAD